MNVIPTERVLPEEEKQKRLDRINEKIKRAEEFAQAKETDVWQVLKLELEEREAQLYENFLNIGNAKISFEREYAAFCVTQHKIKQILSLRDIFENADKKIVTLKAEKEVIKKIKTANPTPTGTQPRNESERGGK